MAHEQWPDPGRPADRLHPDLSWHVIGTGDFNGDHKTDILWRNDSGTLAEWTMDGAQVLAGPQIGSIPDATWKTVAHHYDFV